MTTGTKNNTQPVAILPATSEHGEYTCYRSTTKSWSGADYLHPSTAPKEYGLANGRTFRPRQKRTRTLGEHNYNKSTSDSTTGVMRCSQFISGKWQTVWKNTNPQNVTFLKNAVIYDPSNEYKLLDKLRNRVYGSGFNPAVFAAEMPEALHMIRNASIRIGAGLHRLRSGDWHGVLECFGISPYGRRYFRPATKDLSSLWLEIAYGWKPLLSDTEAASKYIAEALNGGHAGLVRGSRSWVQTVPYSPRGTNTLAYDSLAVKYRLEIIIKALSVSPWYVPSLATVATVAWEKLPYSFVADWFIPVGGYLEALRTSHDISGTVIRSLKTERTFGEVISDNPSQLTVSYCEAADFHWTEMDFIRSISSELKVPSPVDGAKLEALSWQRTANAVSLLVQRDWSSLEKLFLKKAF